MPLRNILNEQFVHAAKKMFLTTVDSLQKGCFSLLKRIQKNSFHTDIIPHPATLFGVTLSSETLCG
jgi:hypothetical protein